MQPALSLTDTAGRLVRGALPSGHCGPALGVNGKCNGNAAVPIYLTPLGRYGNIKMPSAPEALPRGERLLRDTTRFVASLRYATSASSPAYLASEDSMVTGAALRLGPGEVYLGRRKPHGSMGGVQTPPAFSTCSSGVRIDQLRVPACSNRRLSATLTWPINPVIAFGILVFWYSGILVYRYVSASPTRGCEYCLQDIRPPTPCQGLPQETSDSYSTTVSLCCSAASS